MLLTLVHNCWRLRLVFGIGLNVQELNEYHALRAMTNAGAPPGMNNAAFADCFLHLMQQSRLTTLLLERWHRFFQENGDMDRLLTENVEEACHCTKAFPESGVTRRGDSTIFMHPLFSVCPSFYIAWRKASCSSSSRSLEGGKIQGIPKGPRPLLAVTCAPSQMSLSKWFRPRAAGPAIGVVSLVICSV